MRNLDRMPTILAAGVLLCVAACARQTEPPPEAQTPAPNAGHETTAAIAEQASPDDAHALDGTAWRLVKIMSMDDSTYTPDDPDKYTLQFDADGSVRVRADCNLGSGTWSSESPSQLQFGVIAATAAECPPGSLHDRYLGQFPWVRSYVMNDGHLFLATMADGAIIEFEPLSVAAPTD